MISSQDHFPSAAENGDLPFDQIGRPPKLHREIPRHGYYDKIGYDLRNDPRDLNSEILSLPYASKLQRHIDNHILLSADHLAFAQFNQYVSRVQLIFIGSPGRMEKKTGVDPGIA